MGTVEPPLDSRSSTQGAVEIRDQSLTPAESILSPREPAKEEIQALSRFERFAFYLTRRMDYRMTVLLLDLRSSKRFIPRFVAPFRT